MKLVTLFLMSVGLANQSSARREADEFDRRLRISPSATATLHDWCAAHGIADATIHAELVKGPAPPATRRQRRELGVSAAEPLGYRHVRLSCGGHVLSDAENWYVPARLAPAMNATLNATDTPFGTVVRPLGIRRRTLGAEKLWRDGATPPAAVWRHRALVLDAAGRPIAEVIETYLREVVSLHPGADAVPSS